MQNKLTAIQTFIRVAGAGSFSAAARQNGMKQSAVSQQIAALEEALADRAAFVGAAGGQVDAVAARVEALVARHPEAAGYAPGSIL